jgi:NADPH:quinone reductase-like Zn-dependent oxidoreductase
MRAATYDGKGGVEVIEVRDDVPEPELGTDDALIEVAFAGLNRADCLERAGNYPQPRTAITIGGMEYSGTVRATGAHVTNVQIGDRVCGLVPTGAHAERLAANALTLSKIPEGVDFRTAAAIPEAFITAHDALFAHAAFALGQTALVHAVGSSVGLAAVELVKRAGGVAIGTSRTGDKLERARAHGLDFGFLLDDSWQGRVLAATGARGADVILDFVGAPMLEGNAGVLATRGRIVQIGTMGGAQAQVHLGVLMAKRGSIHGTVLRSRPLEEKIALARNFERALLPMFARGELRAELDRTFALSDIRAAHEYMESNANFGKITIRVSGSDARRTP